MTGESLPPAARTARAPWWRSAVIYQIWPQSFGYLTRDWGAYAGLQGDLQRRAGSAGPVLEPALEVWAQVLSAPEPGLVILSAGRRDFGQDAGNPVALAHVRRGTVAPLLARLRLADDRGQRPARAHDRPARPRRRSRRPDRAGPVAPVHHVRQMARRAPRR